MNSAGFFGDIFISKLDNSGNFLWAKQFGGPINDEGHSLTVDLHGDVYTTGFFQQSVDFNPGPGTFMLNSELGGNIFISKLDGLGNFIWAKQMGGGNGDAGRFITTGPSGRLYTTGEFRDTADFYLETGPLNLISAGWDDVYICKLNQGPSGIIRVSEKMTILYPNPTTGKVFVDLGEVHTEITVCIKNVLGQIESQGAYQNTNFLQLDLPDKTGLFFVEITADSKYKASVKNTLKVLNE